MEGHAICTSGKAVAIYCEQLKYIIDCSREHLSYWGRMHGLGPDYRKRAKVLQAQEALYKSLTGIQLKTPGVRRG
jgi:hypothetical protein